MFPPGQGATIGVDFMIKTVEIDEEYASPKVLRGLGGNKIDRDDHEIPADVGEEFANRHGMYFLQTSAKNCDNVDRLFTEIAHELLQQAKAKDLPSESHSVQNISDSSIGQSSSVKSSCCGEKTS